MDLTLVVKRLTRKISQLESKLLLSKQPTLLTDENTVSVEEKKISTGVTMTTFTMSVISKEQAQLYTPLPFLNILVDIDVVADLFNK